MFHIVGDDFELEISSQCLGHVKAQSGNLAALSKGRGKLVLNHSGPTAQVIRGREAKVLGATTGKREEEENKMRAESCKCHPLGITIMGL